MSDIHNQDYTSAIPQFSFSSTLEEQEAELAQNPMVKHFKHLRQSQSADRYIPVYHLTSPEGRLNDPNGLCYWQGRWHLFYQAFPPQDPRQHWAHVVSNDLVHWRDLPHAIYPNPEKACFSGATLVEEDHVVAMYHGLAHGNMVAVSSDPLLLNWEKITGRAVIPCDPDAPYHVFDPCIWKKGDSYYSLSGGRARNPQNGRLIREEFLFRSNDLKTWEYLHPFLEGDIFGLPGDDGACPYFWPLGDRYILLHFSHTSGGNYLIGDYDTDRDKFVVTNGGSFTFGAFLPGGVHAPTAAPDKCGDVVTIFNINSGRKGYNKIMSLPRRLTLCGSNELGIEPAGDIESLRRDYNYVEPMLIPANCETVLNGIQGNVMEIIAEIDTRDANNVELNILRSPDGEEYTRIVFFKDRGYRNWARYSEKTEDKVKRDSLITVDTSRSSILPDVCSRAPETAPVYVKPEEPLKLRIFIDKSVVEIFVNGRQCIALRVYPSRTDSLGVSIRAQGQDAFLQKMDSWQLKSIY